MNERVRGVFARKRRSRHRQVDPRRDQPRASGLLVSAGAQAVDQRRREAAAGAVAANGDACRRDALPAQKAPRHQRIIERRRKRMFRRQAIADSGRARSGAAPGLSHHAAVARNRARAVAAAVEEHQNAARIAAGSDRPFSGHAVEIDGTVLHVLSHRPSGAYFVEALPPLCPAGRPRLRTQQRAYGVDLAAVRHARLACARPNAT